MLHNKLITFLKKSRNDQSFHLTSLQPQNPQTHRQRYQSLIQNRQKKITSSPILPREGKAKR